MSGAAARTGGFKEIESNSSNVNRNQEAGKVQKKANNTEIINKNLEIYR